LAGRNWIDAPTWGFALRFDPTPLWIRGRQKKLSFAPAPGEMFGYSEMQAIDLSKVPHPPLHGFHHMSIHIDTGELRTVVLPYLMRTLGVTRHVLPSHSPKYGVLHGVTLPALLRELYVCDKTVADAPREEDVTVTGHELVEVNLVRIAYQSVRRICGSSPSNLRNLRLEHIDLSSLEWIPKSVEKLHIRECRVEKWDCGVLRALAELKIFGVKLSAPIPKQLNQMFPVLVDMDLRNSGDETLTGVVFPPRLGKLHVYGCLQLTSWNVVLPGLLHWFSVVDCPQLRDINLLSLPSTLERIYFRDIGVRWISTYLVLPRSFDVHDIQGCPDVDVRGVSKSHHLGDRTQSIIKYNWQDAIGLMRRHGVLHYDLVRFLRRFVN
jgi:hypothetical protein